MHGMGRNIGRRTKGLTMHSIVFVRVQRVQNVEETLNEFKRTRLVSRKWCSYTTLGMGTMEVPLNQRIHIPHRYPKMGD